MRLGGKTFGRMLCLLLAGMMLMALNGCVRADTSSNDTSYASDSNGQPENTGAETTDPLTDFGNDSPEETTGGQSDLPQPDEDWGAYRKTVSLNSSTEGIRILGERYLESENQLNCDWTCSGFEFVVDIKGGDLSIRTNTTAGSYFRAFVDGQTWDSDDGTPYFTVNGIQDIVLSGISAGVHTVRVIKVTGYTLSRACFESMTFYGELLTEQTPSAHDLYIEFVGDSISCGWGIIGNHQGAYTDQDGSRAYPYMVAEAMNADYAVTALSGQGLLMGTPGMTKGYLYGSPLRNDTQLYPFSRKADIVIINIGTNDYGYRDQYGITREDFRNAYLNFIRTVYNKNGKNCKIYCLYNSMNDTFASTILEVCASLGGEAAGLYPVRMNRTNSGHPNLEEQSEYADMLVDLLTRTKDNAVTRPIGPFPEDDTQPSTTLTLGAGEGENVVVYVDTDFKSFP